MADARRFTVTIQPETIETLREIAAAFGFISRMGRTKGLGNVSELLDATGSGDVRMSRRSAPEDAAGRIERMQQRVKEAEAGGDPLDVRLARAALAMAEASHALGRFEDRQGPEYHAAWMAYIRANAEHGAAVLAAETARIAQESQGRLDLGPDADTRTNGDVV